MQELKAKDYKSAITPTWCPGCGDYALLSATQKALAELAIPTHQVAIVSGIGCSSNFPHFMATYGMHTLHGRLLPVATGLKLANPRMTVIGTGGDGDGYGIGSGHFTHACRRNVDLTYLVMDNQIYGLTTGQTSPTSSEGHATKSTPQGNIEPPYNPIGTALAEGATFVARGFSGDPKHLAELVRQAIEHKGFSLIDVFSPCVTFNRINTYDWFKETLVPLDGHDVTDRATAFARSLEHALLPYGVFYHDKDAVPYEARDPTLSQGVEPARSVGPRDVAPLIRSMV